MGMSTHVSGFRKPDEEFFKMKKVWDACVDVGVEVPDDVQSFFDWAEPDNTGIEVNLKDLVEKNDDIGMDHEECYQIKLSKIPKNITHIRFTNSY